MSRISTSSSGGNVNIQDTSGNPITATGGALNVNIALSGNGGTPVTPYSLISSVAMGSTATIISYTVTTGKTLYLSRILVSGDSLGIIEVDLNGITTTTSRIGYTDGYNQTIDLSIGSTGLPVASGQVVLVKITNSSQNGPGTYNATIIGIEQ